MGGRIPQALPLPDDHSGTAFSGYPFPSYGSPVECCGSKDSSNGTMISGTSCSWSSSSPEDSFVYVVLNSGVTTLRSSIKIIRTDSLDDIAHSPLEQTERKEDSHSPNLALKTLLRSRSSDDLQESPSMDFTAVCLHPVEHHQSLESLTFSDMTRSTYSLEELDQFEKTSCGLPSSPETSLYRDNQHSALRSTADEGLIVLGSLVNANVQDVDENALTAESDTNTPTIGKTLCTITSFVPTSTVDNHNELSHLPANKNSHQCQNVSTDYNVHESFPATTLPIPVTSNLRISSPAKMRLCLLQDEYCLRSIFHACFCVRKRPLCHL